MIQIDQHLSLSPVYIYNAGSTEYKNNYVCSIRNEGVDYNILERSQRDLESNKPIIYYKTLLIQYAFRV